MPILSPPPVKIPKKFQDDPDTMAFFKEVTRAMYETFFAIGGNSQNSGIPTIEFVTDLDNTGIAGSNTFTGQTDTPTTDPGWVSSSSVNMNAPDGYIKFFVGTQAVTVPFWNT